MAASSASSSLQSLRKKELVELAKSLNIDRDGLKSDLEARISEYLAQHEHQLRDDPRYSNYYSRVLASPGPVGSVLSARRVPPSAKKQQEQLDNEEFETPVKHSPQISRSSKQQQASPSEPNSNEPDEEKEEEEEKVTLKNTIQDSMDFLGDLFLDILDLVFDGFHWVRQRLSTLSFCFASEGIYEFYRLISHIIQPHLRIGLAEIPSLHRIIKYHYVDSHFIHTCWRPLLVWFALSILVPSLIAYFINFTLIAKRKPNHLAIDPFVFAIVKLLLSYFILPSATETKIDQGLGDLMPQPPSSESLFQIKQALDNTPLIAGVVGVLLALYRVSLL